MKVRFNLSIEEEFVRKAKVLAALEGKVIGEYIGELIGRAWEEHEDKSDGKIH